jgi:hypothetical protein
MKILKFDLKKKKRPPKPQEPKLYPLPEEVLIQPPEERDQAPYHSRPAPKKPETE